MIWIGIVLSAAIFLIFKNIQYNRTVQRQNRLQDKQEALIEMVQKKAAEEKENENSNEN